ncbi:MAG: rhodanese-like domain-containing protein [Armatimonadetes bacterium]|nr:rhodanese-like domain-containing protein [Armatimonadota bacterium]
MTQNTNTNPWGKAFREARTVLLPVIVVAIGFNLFSATGVPWVRTMPQGPAISNDELFGGDTTAAPANTLPPTIAESPHDTATANDSAAAIAALEQQRVEDSLKAARKAAADSIQKAKAAEAQVKEAENVQKGTVKEITTDQAKMLFDRKKGFWIDARPADLYAKGHIPRAINIFPEELRKHINDLPASDLNTLIVVYCNGGLCELSHELANSLVAMGFTRVVVYTGGEAEWSERGYPLVTK